MKKLFLGLLAVSLSLVGCDKKKSDPEPSGPVDPLTPSQRANATATNEIIYDTVKNAYGEEVAEANKEYIAARSEHAAAKDVEAEKITAYLEAAAEVDFEQPMQILSFVLEIHQDGGLDDAVYFGVALGESMLKAQIGVAEETEKPMYTAILADIEPEADHIAENAYSALDNICVGIESALALFSGTSMEDTSDTMMFLAYIMQGAPINPDLLKGALHEIRGVVEEFLKVEASVTYFGDFALALAGDLLALYPEVPEGLAPFIAELKVDEIVEAVFAGARDLVAAIDSLPAAYYTHLGEITNPIESYAYALLGAVEALLPEEVLTPEQIQALPAQVVGALQAIFGAVAEFIPEDISAIIAAALEDEALEEFLGAVVQFAVDVGSLDLSFVTAAKVAHIIGVYFGSVQKEEVGTAFTIYDIEDLKNPEIVPASIAAYFPVDEWESIIASHGGIQAEGSDIPFGLSVEADTITATLVSYSVDYAYNLETEAAEFCMHLSIDVITVNYGSVQEIATFINEFLTAFAVKELTDKFVDDLLAVVSPLFDLVTTYVTPNVELDEDAAAALLTIGFIFYTLDNTPAALAGVKAVVNDLFVVVKDIFSAFLPNGETPAAIDFSTFLVLLTQVSPEAALAVVMHSVPEENLQSIKTLATDVYNLVDALGMSLLPKVVKAVCDLTHGYIQPEDIENAEDFANLVYMLAASVLAPYKA